MKTIIKSVSHTIFATVLVFGTAFSQNQPSNSTNEKLTWSHFSFEAGQLFQFSRNFGLEQVQDLDASFGTPTDFSKYTNQQSFGYFNRFSGSTVSLNWHFTKEKEKRTWVWTVGAQFQSMGIGNANYSFQERFAYDTLTSSQTGETYAVDSVHTTSYSMYASSSLLLLNSSLQLQRKFGSRMTLNHGVGIGVGTSVRDHYFKTESAYGHIQSPFQQDNSFYYNGNDYTSSSVSRSGETQTVQVTIPVGFDLVLGKKRPFFKNTLLMFNVQPGLQWYFHQNLGTHFTPSIGTSLGFKFSLLG